MIKETRSHCSPRSFARDQRGTSAIEFALLAPPILLLALGGMELATDILTRSRINALGRLAADNAARISDGTAMQASSVRESDINDLFLGIQMQSGSLDLKRNGRVIISSLETNADGGQWIHWQRCYGAAAFTSAYPVGIGAHGTGFGGVQIKGQTVKARAGDAVMVVEIAYDYTPLVSAQWAGFTTQQIIGRFAMNVRDKRNLSGISPNAPAAQC